jgi:hypothetical protein
MFFACALIAAMSTFPIGWYPPLTTSAELFVGRGGGWYCEGCRWFCSSAMLTFVGWYAGVTFSSCDRETGGAS